MCFLHYFNIYNSLESHVLHVLYIVFQRKDTDQYKFYLDVLASSSLTGKQHIFLLEHRRIS